MFSKIIFYLKYFLRADKVWKFPCKAEVLIFDSTNAHLLTPFLRGHSFEILHTRGEKIYFPLLVKCFFQKGPLSHRYIDAFIFSCSPKLVITFIDNNLTFYEISSRHPHLKTIFIQNGLRGYVGQIFENLKKNVVKNLRVDYFCVFGKTVGKEYQKYIKGELQVIGSIKNNQVVPSIKVGKVLVYISQWQNHGVQLGNHYFSRENYVDQGDQLILSLLLEFCKNKNLSLEIVPRYGIAHQLHNEEKEYFSNILNGKVEFCFGEGNFPSYEVIDKAEMVVSLDSTLGYESAARKNKTVILSIRGTLLNLIGENFGWPGIYPDVGPFWTNLIDSDVIYSVLENVYNMTQVEYEQILIRESFDQIMLYDKDNTRLKELLHFLLK